MNSQVLRNAQTPTLASVFASLRILGLQWNLR